MSVLKLSFTSLKTMQVFFTKMRYSLDYKLSVMHKTQKRVLFRAAAARVRVSSVQEAEIRNIYSCEIETTVLGFPKSGFGLMGVPNTPCLGTPIRGTLFCHS